MSANSHSEDPINQVIRELQRDDIVVIILLLS